MQYREMSTDQINARLDDLNWRVVKAVFQHDKVLLSFQIFDSAKGPTIIIRDVSGKSTKEAKSEFLSMIMRNEV